jgi:peptide/nickel transport system substrate-binding protein
VPGGLNFVGYQSPELDDLLEQGRRTLDQNERKKIYDRLQEVLHRDQPYCFLFAPYALPILSSRFHGVFEAPAGIEHNFIRWWTASVPNRPAYVN